MSPTFHPFPSLPAELRAHIWTLALRDEYHNLRGANRVIELHNYNLGRKKVAVTVSRRYPTVFEINREARYEAAKADGGEWITIYARFASKTEPRSNTSFKVYMKFDRDSIFLSTRFCKKDGHTEILRLKLLHALFPDAESKLQRLLLAVTPISGKNYTSWEGQGIEHYPSLRYVSFVSWQYRLIELLEPTMGHYLRKTWKEGPPPCIWFVPFGPTGSYNMGTKPGENEWSYDCFQEIDGIWRIERGVRSDFGPERTGRMMRRAGPKRAKKEFHTTPFEECWGNLSYGG